MVNGGGERGGALGILSKDCSPALTIRRLEPGHGV